MEKLNQQRDLRVRMYLCPKCNELVPMYYSISEQPPPEVNICRRCKVECLIMEDKESNSTLFDDGNGNHYLNLDNMELKKYVDEGILPEDRGNILTIGEDPDDKDDEQETNNNRSIKSFSRGRQRNYQRKD